jgi:hypothetical protein
MTYALDTNIIIAILRNDKNVEKNWETAVASDSRLITHIKHPNKIVLRISRPWLQTLENKVN